MPHCQHGVVWRDRLSFSTSFPLITPPHFSPSLSSPIAWFPLFSFSVPFSIISPPSFPPVSSSSEYSSATLQMPFSQNIRYICFPLPGFREQDRLHAKCWCEAFLVIITSLGLQENSKLRFNLLLHSKEALLSIAVAISQSQGPGISWDCCDLHQEQI